MIYSNSRISTFKKCPFLWYLTYVVKIERDSSEMTELGKIVHSIAQHMAEGHQQSMAKEMALKENPSEFTFKDEEIDYFISRLKYLVPSKDKILGVEKHCVVPIDDFNELQIFADLIVLNNGKYEVWDWKTGRLYSDPMQLKVYAWVLHKAGIPIDRVKFIYLRAKKEDTIKTMEVTPEVLKEAEDFIYDSIQQIDEFQDALLMAGDITSDEDAMKIFPANANQWCTSCGQSARCMINPPKKAPETMEELLNGNYTDEEKIRYHQQLIASGKMGDDLIQGDTPDEEYEAAEFLAAKILQTESALKSMKDELKQFVEKVGPVRVQDKIFSITESESTKYDKEDIQKIVHTLSLASKNLFDFYDVTAKVKRKLVKEGVFTEDELNKLGKTSIKKVFRASTDPTTMVQKRA